MKVSKTSAKRRKMLLVMPLLVIPFLTLAFYALGGGKGKTEKVVAESGLNLQLPDANLKEEKLMDKLGFYDKADKDSAKLAEWMRSDPYYKEQMQMPEPSTQELEQLTENTASKHNQRLNVSPYETTINKPEDQVMQKLSLLQKELNKNTTPTYSQSNEYGYNRTSPELSGDVDRLEAMMNMMSTGDGEDPEIKQLSTVMDKILDVQHPSRVKERMKEKSMQQSSNALAVSAISSDDTTAKGFYSLDNRIDAKQSNAIEAVVNENQVLVNGAVIKLRLLQDVFVSNQKIPAGTFVFGIVGLNGERLEIEINSIRSGSSLYNVKMEVHDMDGLAGIHIPGAITRDVAKQSADNSLQMMELTTLDPSLKAQATAAGISTAKSLLSRKVKLVKVMVKAGYKVLLKDKSIQ
ncbi:MAG: conjugative transposon protein TraM [Sphingobacteriales bacterium]|nr:conjugative transposon protein TraM [Sphingobacteriales bacterium]OJW01183.1 MAG: conjugative transposon protein TraM [Sphingobacteriales bacterium 44-61]